MSFGFRTICDRWAQNEGGLVIRTLIEVQLFDVSPVTYPAYPQTSAQARSQLEAIHQRALEGEADPAEIAAAKVRHAHRRRLLQIQTMSIFERKTK